MKIVQIFWYRQVHYNVFFFDNRNVVIYDTEFTFVFSVRFKPFDNNLTITDVFNNTNIMICFFAFCGRKLCQHKISHFRAVTSCYITVCVLVFYSIRVWGTSIRSRYCNFGTNIICIVFSLTLMRLLERRYTFSRFYMKSGFLLRGLCTLGTSKPLLF